MSLECLLSLHSGSYHFLLPQPLEHQNFNRLEPQSPTAKHCNAHVDGQHYMVVGEWSLQAMLVAYKETSGNSGWQGTSLIGFVSLSLDLSQS